MKGYTSKRIRVEHIGLTSRNELDQVSGKLIDALGRWIAAAVWASFAIVTCGIALRVW